MKAVLNLLAEGEQLSRVESKEVMLKLASGEFSNEEIAAFLMALNMRPLVVDELLGFRDAMLEKALQVDLSEFESIDIVGTGGDGKNTFNISTCTSFVVAGAGYKVAKHGSYGVSSVSGSANVLMELGVGFTTDKSLLKTALEQANICFLHAPLFHPAMKHVVPVRKALKVKTLFNLLGPLLNPSQPKFGMIGVYKQPLAAVYAHLLRQTNMTFNVVHALDGYDEIALTGDTLSVDNTQEKTLRPQDFGADQIQPEAIFGGNTVPEAAQIFSTILNNEAPEAPKQVVLANAALAIQTITRKPLLEAKQEALEAINSGRAQQALKKLIEITNQ
ncbi:MAG: anthranilate phosphoribosyltransferase [Saprospiraceae bacterium]|nr:anthranilate phosphoribosyltransferase [Saprospiraceae bacterium]